MAVPDFQSIMRPLLEFASDQQIHSIQDAYEDLAEFFRLTAEDLEKRVPCNAPQNLDTKIRFLR
jgi:restriction system protein